MVPKQITEEELKLVKSAVMLPIVMDTLEHDIAKILAADLKVYEVHVAYMRILQECVMEDIKVVKRDLRNKGIKIIEEGKAPNGYRAVYLCRGYKHELVVGSNIIRSTVVVRIAEIMGVPLGDLKR